jgi:hypothetical protein
MPLTQNCNICRKWLTEKEKEESDKVKLPRLCEKHLTELKTKLPKCLSVFQKMKFS